PILLFKRGDKFFLDIQKRWRTNTMKGRLNVHNTGGHYSRSPIDDATNQFVVDPREGFLYSRQESTGALHYFISPGERRPVSALGHEEKQNEMKKRRTLTDTNDKT
ncbi:hypothetical protein, partial [Desulfobacterium sp. N47]|uniref:hypothetical protein n=1 Tax=Desulfobacterium sp. N47 TaxID=3115210 RepID=UPI003F4A13DE